MTTDHVAARTLVKSPPELWAECSDAASLARHIGEFGEISITRLDPETSVAWEAEEASGTVLIEPSAWGTRVTLTAQTKAEGVIEDAATPEQPVPEGMAVPEQPVPDTQPAQEEADAKVEETLASEDPAVAADPAPTGGRWKRLIERTRAWFSPPVDELAPLPEGIVKEPDPASEETVPEAEAIVAEPEAVVAAPEEIAPEAEAVAEAPASAPEDRVDPEAILSAALDSLGQAHHRPFSRA